MHDLLSLLYRLISLLNLLRILPCIGLAFIVFYLWGYDAVWAKIISFLVVDITIYFVIITFLSNPLELLKYVCLKLFFLFLTLFTVVAKIILVVVFIIVWIVYFISPIDIIPDIIVGIGWIDDFLLAVGLILSVANLSLEFPDYKLTDNNSYPVFRNILAVIISTALTYAFRKLG